jgi:hypothetical protein
MDMPRLIDYVGMDNVLPNYTAVVGYNGKNYDVSNRKWHDLKDGTEMVAVMTQKEPKELFIVVRRYKAN